MAESGVRLVAFPVSNLARMLSAMDCGKSLAAEELSSLPYEELRKLGGTLFRDLPNGREMQPKLNIAGTTCPRFSLDGKEAIRVHDSQPHEELPTTEGDGTLFRVQCP